MSHLIRAFPAQPWIQRLPALAPALLITEAFYHFHSFILEAAGFLATWSALDTAVGVVRDRLRG